MITELKQMQQLILKEGQSPAIKLIEILNDYGQTSFSDLVSSYKSQFSLRGREEEGFSPWREYWMKRGLNNDLVTGSWMDIQEFVETRVGKLSQSELAAAITYPDYRIATLAANGQPISADLFMFFVLVIESRADWVHQLVKSQLGFGNDYRSLLKQMATVGLVPSWSY